MRAIVWVDNYFVGIWVEGGCRRGSKVGRRVVLESLEFVGSEKSCLELDEVMESLILE